MNWQGRGVLITGGASFIGSHLTDALVQLGARIRVADNLSGGNRDNLVEHLAKKSIDFHQVNLFDPHVADEMTRDVQTVFHLAASHGGRGYIDLHQVHCSTNMILDGMVFRAAHKNGAEKVVFASSGCVYPISMQTNPDERVYLTEDLVKPPYDADTLYGWAKLMGELVLREYCLEGKLKAACLRYFTAYGPRCPENHAVIAMIARAFIGQDPFVVWGTGQQVRNWTYVADVVEATILAAERIDDGRAINVGTEERTKVVDAVRMILKQAGKNPKLAFDTTKPTGPYNRVSSGRLAREVLGWEPKIMFAQGICSTLDWYFKTHSKTAITLTLEALLTERPGA